MHRSWYLPIGPFEICYLIVEMFLSVVVQWLIIDACKWPHAKPTRVPRPLWHLGFDLCLRRAWSDYWPIDESHNVYMLIDNGLAAAWSFANWIKSYSFWLVLNRLPDGLMNLFIDLVNFVDWPFWDDWLVDWCIDWSFIDWLIDCWSRHRPWSWLILLAIWPIDGGAGRPLLSIWSLFAESSLIERFVDCLAHSTIYFQRLVLYRLSWLIYRLVLYRLINRLLIQASTLILINPFGNLTYWWWSRPAFAIDLVSVCWKFFNWEICWLLGPFDDLFSTIGPLSIDRLLIHSFTLILIDPFGILVADW